LTGFGSEGQRGKGTANNAKNANEAEINGLSKLVVGRALIGANTLGSGFIEKACAHALACELHQRDVAVAQQGGVIIRYDAAIVCEYTTDLPVENAVLVELKAVTTLDDIHFAECLNCREATGLRPYVLLKFGTPRAEIDVPFKIFEAPDLFALFAFICG
jgi:GxxExxY protein